MRTLCYAVGPLFAGVLLGLALDVPLWYSFTSGTVCALSYLALTLDGLRREVSELWRYLP